MTNNHGKSTNALADKLRDINSPGFIAKLTPTEADELFFEEPAISEEDALEDSADLVDTDE